MSILTKWLSRRSIPHEVLPSKNLLLKADEVSISRDRNGTLGICFCFGERWKNQALLVDLSDEQAAFITRALNRDRWPEGASFVAPGVK